MIPPPEGVRQFLEKAEGALHRRHGWDGPPLFAALSYRPHRDRKVKASPIPMPDGKAAEHLAHMADAFDEGHPAAVQAVRSLGVDSGFAGLALIFEGWAGERKPPDGLGVADMPDAFEVRLAVAVDCGGRLHMLGRKRGSAPVSDYLRDIVGRVPHALRRMVLGAALAMPFGSADLDALRQLDTDPDRMPAGWTEAK